MNSIRALNTLSNVYTNSQDRVVTIEKQSEGTWRIKTVILRDSGSTTYTSIGISFYIKDTNTYVLQAVSVPGNILSEYTAVNVQNRTVVQFQGLRQTVGTTLNSITFGNFSRKDVNKNKNKNKYECQDDDDC